MQKRILLLVILFTFTLAGCISLGNHSRGAEIFKIKLSSLKPGDFPDYINRLTEVANSSNKGNLKRKGMLYIARACTCHRNPNPDYDRALDCYLEYRKLGKGNESDEFLNWIHVLDHIGKLKKELKELKEMRTLSEKQNQILLENIRKQDVMIKKLESKIKKLDSLYFQIEKKKKKNHNSQQP